MGQSQEMMLIKKSEIKSFQIASFSVILSVIFKVRPIFAMLPENKHHFAQRCSAAGKESA